MSSKKVCADQSQVETKREFEQPSLLESEMITIKPKDKEPFDDNQEVRVDSMRKSTAFEKKDDSKQSDVIQPDSPSEGIPVKMDDSSPDNKEDRLRSLLEMFHLLPQNEISSTERPDEIPQRKLLEPTFAPSKVETISTEMDTLKVPVEEETRTKEPSDSEVTLITPEGKANYETLAVIEIPVDLHETPFVTGDWAEPMNYQELYIPYKRRKSSAIGIIPPIEVQNH